MARGQDGYLAGRLERSSGDHIVAVSHLGEPLSRAVGGSALPASAVGPFIELDHSDYLLLNFRQVGTGVIIPNKGLMPKSLTAQPVNDTTAAIDV